MEKRLGDADPIATTTALETTDPAEFEIALRPWELLCRPRNSRDFRHTMTGLTTTGFTIYREQFDTPVNVVGISPAETLVIGSPLCIGREARYWGTPYSGSTMPSSLPGPLDVRLDAGHHHQVIIIRSSSSGSLFCDPRYQKKPSMD